MSIVKLSKVTVYGRTDEKARVLADLQEMGCLHLIPLRLEDEPLHGGGPSSESREALKFLASCPHRLRQVEHNERFDASRLEASALDIKRKIAELEDESDFLRVRLQNLKPWGRFSFPDPADIADLKFWFYAVPHSDMPRVEAAGLVWEAVSRDNRFVYLVVIAKEEPKAMPVPRIRAGSRSIDELERRRRHVVRRLEALHARRANLTRWLYLFTKSIYRLEDRATLERASRQTHDDNPVFVIQAWVPRRDLARLKNYVQENAMAIEIERALKDDDVPTLLANARPIAAGEDLVTFYTTPPYWLWDPSIVVFFSFAVFFAMIISDAAYGCMLGIVVAALWRRMGDSAVGRRMRMLGVVLTAFTIFYGVMAGSYFGVAPRTGGVLAHLKVIDLNDFSSMMTISIVVGIIHLVIANIADLWRRRWSLAMLGPAGWICIWVGGVIVWKGMAAHTKAAQSAGASLAAAGAALVLLFSSVRGPLWRRLLAGLTGLARLSGAFGDTLSYLRLFALGLASASLAITFNDLARQVGDAVPGIGFLFYLLIIVLGHGLNLALAVASGVIHGLRLNFIEFFNWGMPEEGHPFRAFERKEKATWTISSSR